MAHHAQHRIVTPPRLWTRIRVHLPFAVYGMCTTAAFGYITAQIVRTLAG